MNQQTQKEAVFNAVTSVLAEAGVEVNNGDNYSNHLTRELRSQVSSILVEGFKSGTIQLEKAFTDTQLKSYVSGLMSNWLKKDKRLNGGVSYVAKNPGSRVGSSDPTLKALRALRSTLTVESEIAEVDSHITARIAEIKPAKTKSTVAVDFSALPAELASKFQK